MIEVTDVSFSIAKKVESGSCGFCRVIINDCVAINRIKVSKMDDEYYVLLPKSDYGSNDGKPIVQLLNKETINLVRDAVLEKYHRLIEENNGLYKQDTKFKKVVHIGG